MENKFLESEDNYFDEDLINLQNSEDDFEPVIEIKPKKPRIKHRFCIAS